MAGWILCPMKIVKNQFTILKIVTELGVLCGKSGSSLYLRTMECLCLLCLFAVLSSIFLSLLAKGLSPPDVPHTVENAVARYPRFPNIGASKELDRHLLILRIVPTMLKVLN
jgi:hypothetical protein